MSEYQRYEFMACDQPLTRAQLSAVNALSSHIEATSTHALIEYQWGDFKHNPIEVLHQFFDGFLYWANWGAPELALRFPHGLLPSTLLTGFDVADCVTFRQYPDYDILDIQFSEMEGPDEWVDYELGSLIALRTELMQQDRRPIYIVWLASQHMRDANEEDELLAAPSVPPGLQQLTAAQQALAELLQVSSALLVAAARHSPTRIIETVEDVAKWVPLLPAKRRDDYVMRLARNEPGLSYQLVRELRELGQEAMPLSSEGIPYATLRDESQRIQAQWEQEHHEQEQLARQRHVHDIHQHQAEYWQQLDRAVLRTSGAGYDEATRLLVELRSVADEFNEAPQFQDRFLTWVQPHLQRPAFVKRLQDHQFTLPER